MAMHREGFSLFPALRRPSSDTHEKLELTTAQGVELKNLGSVVAPPFPFTGSSKHMAMAPLWGSHSKRKLFRKGMTSYRNGNYREAGDFLEQAAKVEPDAEDVRFYLGICQLLNGRSADRNRHLKTSYSNEFRG